MKALTIKRTKAAISTPAGEIPADWTWAPLHRVSVIQTGISKSANREGDTVTMPYLRVANVQDGHFILNEIKAIEVPLNQLERFLVKAGDLVLTEGGDADKLGRGALWSGQIDPCVHQNHLFVVRANDTVLDSRFLASCTQAPRGRRYFRSCSKQSTNLASINSTQLKQFPVPLPPLPEQRMIADILGTWDDALEKFDALIAGKQQAKLGLMQQLLSGRRRLPGFKGKWVKSRLGLVAENVSRRNSGDLGWDRLYAVTKASGMIPMRAHVMGLSTDRCKRVENGSFAYNPMRLNIGSIARWSGEEPVMVSPDYVVFRCKEGALSPRYFEHLRQADRWTQFVSGRGNGSVRVRLYFSDIASFEFLKPPFLEQEAIADVLDTCDEELRLLGERRKALDLQKQGLMERLLTGALRVCP